MNAFVVPSSTGTAWLLLGIAGLLEVTWLVLLKQSEGLSRAWPAVASIALAWLSFYLLSVVLRTLPAGTAYAVWTGIGAAGGAIAGMLLFGESRETMRIAGIAAIVIGIVTVRLAE